MRFYSAPPTVQSHAAVTWPATIDGVDLGNTSVEVIGVGLGDQAASTLPGELTITNLGNVRGVYVQVVLKAGVAPSGVSVTAADTGTTKSWPAAGLTLVPIETGAGGLLTDGSYEGFFSRNALAGAAATQATLSADVSGTGPAGNLSPRAFVAYVFRDNTSSASVGKTTNVFVFGQNTSGVINGNPGIIPANPVAKETLTIPVSSTARDVNVAFVISDIEVGDARIIILEAEAGGVTSYGVFDGPNQGKELLIANLTLQNVPAGANQVTARVISPPSTNPDPRDRRRGDSVFWNGVSATVRVEPPPAGGHGCTPGFWRNWTGKGPQPNAWAQTGYSPDQLFSSVFDDAFPGKTLHQVVSQGGGGLNALGRHTVAALLNAAHPNVSYDLSASEVIAQFNAVYPGNTAAYNRLKDAFEAFNEQGCSLSRTNF
jgi:hypothetical protein